MNTFNRVFVVLWLVDLIVMLILGILQPMRSIEALRSGLANLQGLVAANFLLSLALAGALLALAVLLLILELRRPVRLTVKVQQSSGGFVELSTESVARSLEYHLGQVQGITQVQPKVTSKGKSVRVSLVVETDPQMDIPAKSEEVVQSARELIEGKLGLKLAAGGLWVSIRHAPFGRKVRPVVEPEELPEVPAEGPAPL